MKVNSFPSWIKTTRQEAIVFDWMYRQPKHEVTFSYLYELVMKDFPRIKKPRLSDVLRHLEAKDLVERAKRHGEWRVTLGTTKKLLSSMKKPVEETNDE